MTTFALFKSDQPKVETTRINSTVTSAISIPVMVNGEQVPIRVMVVDAGVKSVENLREIAKRLTIISG